MPTRDYTPPGIEKKELEEIFRRALPDDKFISAEIAGQGSSNLVYKVVCDNNSYIAKIAYRPDRIKAGVIEKEEKMLKLFGRQPLPIPIPGFVWSGRASSGLPALIETYLAGEHAEKLLPQLQDRADLARTLGRFAAELHGNFENFISEFKIDRPNHPNFADYATAMLKKWKVSLLKAQHVSQADISKAYQVIIAALPLFTENHWPYVHADLSQENLFGKLENGKLKLTGLCDFENVMTAPPEYEFATLDDTFFLFYPEMERPFYESYAGCRPLPENFEKRLRAVNLLRALRYIRRSVEYRETHYFEHDLKFFKRWIDR